MKKREYIMGHSLLYCSSLPDQLIVCKWNVPPSNTICINTDASKTDSGSDYGFIVRDHDVNVLYGTCGPLDEEDINIVELKCIFEATRWGLVNNYNEVVLLSDSNMVADCLNGDCAIPWKYLRLVRDIQVIARSIQHLSMQC